MLAIRPLVDATLLLDSHIVGYNGHALNLHWVYPYLVAAKSSQNMYHQMGNHHVGEPLSSKDPHDELLNHTKNSNGCLQRRISFMQAVITTRHKQTPLLIKQCSKLA